MHVAIAGVEHVGHPQPVFPGQLGDAPEYPRQFTAGYGAVHAVVVRRNAPHRGKGVLAPSPETHAFGLVAGQAYLAGTGLAQQGGDALAVVLHVRFHTVQLAQQDRRRLHRVTGVDEVFGGADGQVVHHLQAAWDNAGGDDIGDRAAGLLDAVEAGQQHPRDLGLGQELDGDFGDDAKHAFGAGEQRQQVEAGAIQASLPRVRCSPSTVRMSTLSRLCTVRPYLRQCTPPAFSATLPPMEQAICEEGSGA